MVDLRLFHDTLVVVVADDGRGLDPSRPSGVGLSSMRERAAEVGGTVVVHAAADGTEVTAGPVEDDASDADVSATRRLDDGGTLTLTRSGDEVQDRITEALLPLIFLGVGLLALTAAGASLIARRLSRPFQELAVAATDLGHGRFDREVKHYSIPEAEAIATALRTSAGSRQAHLASSPSCGMRRLRTSPAWLHRACLRAVCL